MLLSPATIGAIQQDPIRRAFRQSSLDLRFADNKSLVDAQTGASLVTFTRASTGTYVGSDGVLRSAVTNLLLRSEEFGTTWTATRASVSTDATLAPNGTTTADKLVEDTTATNTHQLQQAVTLVANTTYTTSFYIKSGERTELRLLFTAGTDGINAAFNLSTGAATAQANTGSGVIASATLTPVGNGWFRATATGLISPISTSATLTLRLLSSGSNSYTGDGTSGLFLWGAQLEQSATVGEYIPTTSTINSAPRFDHNPTTGESLGLLVEEARTNLLLRSEEFNDAYWTTSVLVASNSTTSPDGVLTADLLADTVDASAQAHQVSRILPVTSGVAYALSAYIKAGTGIGFSLGASAGAFTVEQRVVFNAVTGVATLSLGTPTNISITPVGSGWYRCSCVITPTTTGNATIVLRLYNSAGAGFYQGDGTQNAYLWGAQLEAGAFPTSYIPTTTATVTRAADVASITGTNFSSWYNQTEGTVFFEGINPAISTTAFAVSDGSTNNRLQMESGTNSRIARVVSGGTTQAANSIAYTYGTSQRFAISYATDSINFANAGTLGTEDTSATIPIVDQLRIGANPTGANPLNNTIKRLTYFPTRLSNTVLQQISQP